PEGEKNVYKNYEGSGGFPVSSFIRKALLAARFQTLKILFSDDINSESRVLMYRNITERVLKVAPFLRLDSDPYLVITEGRMKWIYDAYTVSELFPYSQNIPQFGNYVRNSVKVVIDAYEGSMMFYISDPSDPIILTWQKVFPELFKDLSEMSEDLRKHIRYPSDLFTIQAFIYATYHMKTPQVFYNKEDQWEIPEIDNKMMEPYYTIMKLPGNKTEEYILMLPFTPSGKSNLSAWMVAQSDGENYGKLIAYTFPKQKLIYGPNQIVARINQDAEVSRQISLWDQRGSKVIQGTMLVIPIEESLIYVRPLYLKADAGKIPELKRVIVGYEDTIAMERTLEEALAKIFGEDTFSSVANTTDTKGIKSELTKPNESTSNMILKQSDYKTIKNMFESVMKRQEEMNRKLSFHNKDLRALGKALESATVAD
ncbi:MAG: COG1615 family transporter, partial [Nitrospina sp.]|nr:COG1615 family transporter [Nitrospina sp.]